MENRGRGNITDRMSISDLAVCAADVIGFVSYMTSPAIES